MLIMYIGNTILDCHAFTYPYIPLWFKRFCQRIEAHCSSHRRHYNHMYPHPIWIPQPPAPTNRYSSLSLSIYLSLSLFQSTYLYKIHI